jgi:hypothetical protein
VQRRRGVRVRVRVWAEVLEHLQVGEELSELLGVEIIVFGLVSLAPCQSELCRPSKERKGEKRKEDIRHNKKLRVPSVLTVITAVTPKS